jgi:hypothetical protein
MSRLLIAGVACAALAFLSIRLFRPPEEGVSAFSMPSGVAVAVLILRYRIKHALGSGYGLKPVERTGSAAGPRARRHPRRHPASLY